MLRSLVAVGVLVLFSSSATSASFMPLGDLPGGSFLSYATGVSTDGAVVVGAASSQFGMQTFRWTSDGGMVGLGDLAGGGYQSVARGASADGAVVVGMATSASGSEAVVWTQSDGIQRLLDVLVAGGATGLTGWTLTSALGISADGQTVVGFAVNPLYGSEAFLANIAPAVVPAPPPSGSSPLLSA